MTWTYNQASWGVLGGYYLTVEETSPLERNILTNQFIPYGTLSYNIYIGACHRDQIFPVAPNPKKPSRAF